MNSEVYGVGTDILQFRRIENILGDPEGRNSFLVRTYTALEIELINSVPEPLHRYATHFCAKEAVYKSLLLSPELKFAWNEIEILYTPEGCPYAVLHGEISKAASEKGIVKISISISYDGDYAVAHAVTCRSER